MVLYPVAGGRSFNFLAFSSDPDRQEEWRSNDWVVEANHEELAAHFKDFEPEAQSIIKVKGT